MSGRMKQFFWILGYIMVIGEGLWLFCSLLTFAGLVIFGLQTQSVTVQQGLIFLASAIGFFAKALLPGAILGFLLLSRWFREEGSFSLMPVASILIPLIGVAQSAVLALLFYILQHRGSSIVTTASLIWLVLLTAGLLGMARKRIVLWLTVGSIFIGVVWGLWLSMKIS